MTEAHLNRLGYGDTPFTVLFKTAGIKLYCVVLNFIVCLRDVTAENTTIASESLSGEITGKTYEAKKIHP